MLEQEPPPQSFHYCFSSGVLRRSFSEASKQFPQKEALRECRWWDLVSTPEPACGEGKIKIKSDKINILLGRGKNRVLPLVKCFFPVQKVNAKMTTAALATISLSSFPFLWQKRPPLWDEWVEVFHLSHWSSSEAWIHGKGIIQIMWHKE